MKKIILMTIMCIMTLSAMAQIKSVDVKGNLRGDFGLGVGVTMPLQENIDFSPSFNYYFSEGVTYTIDADLHYNFNLEQGWSVYPLVGLLWFHHAPKMGEGDINKIGANIGGGARYNIDSQWAVLAEAKYQWVSNFNETFFSIGVSYKF